MPFMRSEPAPVTSRDMVDLMAALVVAQSNLSALRRRLNNGEATLTGEQAHDVSTMQAILARSCGKTQEAVVRSRQATRPRA